MVIEHSEDQQVFGVVGVSYKDCPLYLRENIALEEKKLVSVLTELKQAWKNPNIVVLATCNRVEIYFYLPKTANGAEPLWLNFVQKSTKNQQTAPLLSYALYQEQAIEHLFGVCASLDSMVLGETQILGQVKRSYQMSQSVQPFTMQFSRIFEAAFHTAKRVRNETKISQNPQSVGRVSVELAKSVFSDIADNKALVIGAGEIAELVLRYLKNAGVKKISVTNRSYQNAAKLAQSYQAITLPFADFLTGLSSVDIVISSIAVEQPLLDFTMMEKVMKARRYKSLFLIDLGVPRNISAEVSELENVFLFNIDDLQSVTEDGQRLRQQEAEQAQAIVQAEKSIFFDYWQQPRNAHSIALFRNHIHQLIQDKLKPQLESFAQTPEQRKQMDVILARFGNQLLHHPSLYLRNRPLSDNEAISILLEAFQVPLEQPNKATDAAPQGAKIIPWP